MFSVESNFYRIEVGNLHYFAIKYGRKCLFSRTSQHSVQEVVLCSILNITEFNSVKFSHLADKFWVEIHNAIAKSDRVQKTEKLSCSYQRFGDSDRHQTIRIVIDSIIRKSFLSIPNIFPKALIVSCIDFIRFFGSIIKHLTV